MSINFSPKSVVETCPDCVVVPCPKHCHKGVLQTESFEFVSIIKSLLSNGGTYQVEVTVSRDPEPSAVAAAVLPATG